MALLETSKLMKKNVSIFCGWGRIVMAQTFNGPESLANELIDENPGKRDIATYVTKPHLVLSRAPQQLFLDPSDMLRLDLINFDDAKTKMPEGILIRPIQTQSEAATINKLYLSRGMVPTEPNYIWHNAQSQKLLFLVAEDTVTDDIIGTVMGLDHKVVFDDPELGSSLWCLAVDPLASRPGVGEALVRALATEFKQRDRKFMDLSVIHDNEEAKKLYKKIGFNEQPQFFSVKNKNAYNEALFIGPQLEEKLNPYAKIIVDEARSRGINVEILDAEEGYFRLNRGGKSITCRESLSELTSAVAMSRCQDKYTTHRWLSKAGLNIPIFQLAENSEKDASFLKQYGNVVVKPTNSEQGKGISIGIDNEDDLQKAIDKAHRYSERVLLETCHPGEDLRVVVINYSVVAAAIRKPATIIGDGIHDARTLILKQSRRRQAATQGESCIPIDRETEKCLFANNYKYDSVIPSGEVLIVRKTANLHTGGTIHDVTDILHPRLVDAAVKAARQLDIPVVGLDFMIKSADEPDYTIIEANERVGLANHEPQPTAQKFMDLLFPLSAVANNRHYIGGQQ